MCTYHVYLLASRSRALYIGVSNDLVRRVIQHKRAEPAGHTARYRITMLVYFEAFKDARTAIGREKQLKRWPRARKVRLIERHNPDWRDLSRDWLGPEFSNRA